MTWKTESLGEFYARATRGADDAALGAIVDITRDTYKETKRETPISSIVTRTAKRASGTLRESIVELTPKRKGSTLIGGVMTLDEIATHVEYGTGIWGKKGRKYLIVPTRANALQFIAWNSSTIAGRNDGRYKGGRYKINTKFVTTKRVLHPGSPGAHMFLKGLQYGEAFAPVRVETNYRKWAWSMRSTYRK